MFRRPTTVIALLAGLALAAAPAAVQAGASPATEYQSPTKDVLSAVACPAVASCFAVGGTSDGFDSGGTLAQHWDGRVWTSQATPDQQGGSALAGVSCPTVTMCLAVGANAREADLYPLAMAWNGHSWTAQPAGPDGYAPRGVSCVSPDWCMAVGSAAGQDAAELWNGTGWQAVTVGSLGSPGSSLASVSCVSTTFCLAVGTYAPVNEPTHAQAYSWNGQTWQSAALPAQDPSANPGLNAVTCRSATWCLAVGGLDATATSSAAPLALHWNGTGWQQDTVPQPVSGRSNYLDAVSCPSAASCIATGSAQYFAAATPLAESWNGTSWTADSLPAIPGISYPSGLSGLACTNASHCVAAGASSVLDTSIRLTMIRGNGTWRVPTPHGYLVQLANGGVDNFGVSWYGSRRGASAPATSIASNQFTGGYWVLTSDGGVQNDDAPWWGSQRGDLPAGVKAVAMTSSPFLHGYWILDSDGGLLQYMNPWDGSERGHLTSPPVGLAASAKGPSSGYWILNADGGVQNDEAPFYGSQKGQLPAGVTAKAIAADPRTGGYWIVDSNGGVQNDNAPFYGSQRGALPAGVTAVGIAADPVTGGYWITDSDGQVVGENAPVLGSASGSTVGIAGL